MATAWWTAKVMLPVSEGNLNAPCCMFEAKKACHMSTDNGMLTGSQCVSTCFANKKCIAAAMQGSNHATSGECWIREKTGNEDDDGVCIDDHEVGTHGGFTKAWRKVCDEKLCKGIYGEKPKTTTTTTTARPKTTADPAVAECDYETEYDAQPKATAAADAIDEWCTTDDANEFLGPGRNWLKDWPGARFKIGCDYYARGLGPGIKCYGNTEHCVGEHATSGDSYGHTKQLSSLGVMTARECSEACVTVSNKFRGAHGGNGFCNKGCQWAAKDGAGRLAPAKSDAKCTKITRCTADEYEEQGPTTYTDRVCKRLLTCEGGKFIRTNDCVNFVKKLNSAVLVELKNAGRNDDADHLFECYYGVYLAWPKDTCTDEVKFMSEFSEFPLSFSCENRGQPSSRMQAPDADTCARNIENLISLSSVKTTTTTTTTMTKTSTTTTTIRCDAGTYLDGESTACTACPAGQYQADSDHRHAACNAHVPCSTDEFLATKGTSTTPNSCTSHTECAATEYQSVAPVAGSTDRECTGVTSCKAGEYVAVAPTASSNRECGDCDPSDFHFSRVANQRECDTFDMCNGNQKVGVRGTSTSDLECEACGAGYYQDEVAHRYDECKQTTTTTTTASTTTSTWTSTSTTESSTTTSETATTTTQTTSTTSTVSTTTTTSQCCIALSRPPA